MTGEPKHDGTVLLRAIYHGNSVSVGRATDAELDATAVPIDPAIARDVLNAWSLVAVRDPDGRGTQVHTLGWRVGLGNTWITSALVGVDLQARAVSPKFGHAYRFKLQDGMKLAPSLRDHLGYALRTWGFTDVGH